MGAHTASPASPSTGTAYVAKPIASINKLQNRKMKPIHLMSASLHTCRRREEGIPGKELGDGCGSEAYVGKGTPRVVPHPGSLLCTIVVAPVLRWVVLLLPVATTSCGG